MSRAALLYGDHTLLDEYNGRVSSKLNTKSSLIEGECSKTVGFVRGMQQMMFDLFTYNPFRTYLGQCGAVGALLDAKKQLYRLMSLLLSELGMIFEIRCSSPWQISSELQARGIIGEFENASIKVCLSIANKIRLKTYFTNNGQKELFSPVPHANATEQSSTDVPIFRDFGEDVVVHLLSTSNDIFERCHKFCVKFLQQDEIDISIFHNPSVVSSKPALLGGLYTRLQNFPKALEWLKLVSKDSPSYAVSLHSQGFIYLLYEEFEECLKFHEKSLEVYNQKGDSSSVDALLCKRNIAYTLLKMGKCEKARMMLEKTIKEHDEIFCNAIGEGFRTYVRCNLMHTLGKAYYDFGDVRSALETFQKVEQMQSELTDVTDMDVIQLNSFIALSFDRLNQHEQSLEYMKRTLQLAQKVFGENKLSILLVDIYGNAAAVYGRCNRNDEALSLITRSLKLLQLLFGDNPHPGKMVN